MTITDQIEQIKGWHHQRNLIHGSTDKDQCLKLVQESGELAEHLINGADIDDDIGDMAVVLINIAERNGIEIARCFVRGSGERHPLMMNCYYGLSRQIGLLSDAICKGKPLAAPLTEMAECIRDVADCDGVDFWHCLAVAWDDIKDRKGEMRDGVFIKEGDL